MSSLPWKITWPPPIRYACASDACNTTRPDSQSMLQEQTDGKGEAEPTWRGMGAHVWEGGDVDREDLADGLAGDGQQLLGGLRDA